MYVLTLIYTRDLEEVDRHMRAHVAWLKEGYDAGMFLVSGRQIPRVGGIILARGEREAVEAMAQRDPFVEADVARSEVTQFRATQTADDLDFLKE